MKKLVIASGNKGKLEEIQALLSTMSIEVLPQSFFNVPEAPEPHCTFIENALAKARNASFAGEPKDDEKNNAHLLKVLKQHHNRFAYYYCCMVLVRKHDDPQPLIAEGIWSGAILKKARGSNGFGYDPLFMDNKTGKSGAELPPEIKNKISHRGQALRKMLLLIENLPSD